MKTVKSPKQSTTVPSKSCGAKATGPTENTNSNTTKKTNQDMLRTTQIEHNLGTVARKSLTWFVKVPVASYISLKSLIVGYWNNS